ncbi:MAG: hypothetical protein AB2L14_04380 [Candidatus Xenobiia bacterium LiM19]
MFNSIAGDRTPLTGSYSPGVGSADDRKAVREQKLEESLAATQVAPPGPDQIKELSGFYGKALTSVEQIRYPFTFPALDRKESPDSSSSQAAGSAGSPASPSNVKYLTGKEAAGQADEIKSYIDDEMGRLISSDNSKDDLDRRKGHVQIEYFGEDGYRARLDYDPRTRKPLHLENEVNIGHTWKYGYDRGSDSVPETYTRESITPSAGDEGAQNGGAVSHHQKHTVLKNSDGSTSVREEEGTTRE